MEIKFLPKTLACFFIASMCVISAGAQTMGPAQNDSVSTPINTALEIDVRANDNYEESSYNTTDCNSAQLPSHGTISISNHKIIYTPTAGYEGIDQFKYCLADNFFSITTDTAIVYIVVGAAGASINDGSGRANFFKVYPNPSHHQAITVELENTPTQEMGLKLYNLLGEMVYAQAIQSKIANATAVISTEHLVSGIYFLELHTATGSFLQKVIIQ